MVNIQITVSSDFLEEIVSKFQWRC